MLNLIAVLIRARTRAKIKATRLSFSRIDR